MKRLILATPFLAAVVVLLDGWFKAIALARFPLDSDLAHPGLAALAIHRNYGIAFNIPLKIPIVLLISVVLGAVLLNVAWHNRKGNLPLSMAALLVVIGGLGNVYDRLAYGFTVDYLLFFGRSAINLSDLVILAGIVWLLLASRPEKGMKGELTEG